MECMKKSDVSRNIYDCVVRVTICWTEYRSIDIKIKGPTDSHRDRSTTSKTQKNRNINLGKAILLRD